MLNDHQVAFHPFIWLSNADANEGGGYKAHVGIYRNDNEVQWIDAITALNFPDCPDELETAASQALEAANALNDEQGLEDPYDVYADQGVLELPPDAYVGPLEATGEPRRDRFQRGRRRGRGRRQANRYTNRRSQGSQRQATGRSTARPAPTINAKVQAALQRQHDEMAEFETKKADEDAHREQVRSSFTPTTTSTDAESPTS